MQFYSTHNHQTRVSLKEAVLQGLANDRGLFMPETIERLPQSTLSAWSTLSFHEMAFALASPYLKGSMDSATLQQLIQDAFPFEVPLVEIVPGLHSLELYHGPTLAFKDFGARFMARLLGYFTRGLDKEITVLVATSGDTGSAVANGFLGVKGVRVFVLYPSGLVSPSQEKQFTTLGQNITALEVNGSFDNCQFLVKQAFMDAKLRNALILTSANSINLGRLIPQMFYYGWAAGQLAANAKQLVGCVPSGNFGNLTAGLMARRMGVPIDHFIAATNRNDIVPEYLTTGIFAPRPSIPTLANAMDVGDPSNFERIIDLYNQSHEAVSADITGYHYTDAQVRETMRSCFSQHGYMLDPHGAIGFRALSEYLAQHPNHTGFFLETAHPAKFSETVSETLLTTPSVPPRLQAFLSGEKKSIGMEADFEAFKQILLA